MSESARARNVIIIMNDEQRHDTLSFFDHPVVRTPNLDAFARESLVFDNAHCVEPICIPSRVSFFRGLYPHRTGAIRNSASELIPKGVPTLLDIFRANGFELAYSGKNHAFAPEKGAELFHFLDEQDHWGKPGGELRRRDREYRDYIADGRAGMGLIDEPAPFEPEECPTRRVVEEALRYLDHRSGKPFVLTVSFPDPHFPHVVPEPYFSRYRPEDMPDPEVPDLDWSTQPFRHFYLHHLIGVTDLAPLKLKRILANYYGQISFIDDALQPLFQRLRREGLDRDTIVIYTSDHGDYGGRYGVHGKGTLHDVLLRVPFIIRTPEMAGGRRTSARISNIDVLPTLLDYFDLEMPADIQGESFLPVVESRASEHRDAIFAEGGYLGHPPDGPHDALTREFLELREKLEQDWDRHEPAYHDFRRRGEASEPAGMGAWAKGFLRRGRPVTIKHGRWRYGFTPGDREDLYDLEDDPFETRNLAADPACAAVKDELKTRLLDWVLLQSCPDPSR